MVWTLARSFNDMGTVRNDSFVDFDQTEELYSCVCSKGCFVKVYFVTCSLFNGLSSCRDLVYTLF